MHQDISKEKDVVKSDNSLVATRTCWACAEVGGRGVVVVFPMVEGEQDKDWEEEDRNPDWDRDDNCVDEA